MRKEILSEREAQSVVTWRRQQLVESGFPPRLAKRVANDTRFDLHALLVLVERDCRPELAVRILAPLDRGGST
jgi:hypothetical protein